MKKISLLVVLLLSASSLIYAGNYGAGSYGLGDYGTGEVTSVPSGGSGGTSSHKGGGEVDECIQDSDCGTDKYCFEHLCRDAECFNDSDCNTPEGEVCWNNRCVKLFDIEILGFDSPVRVGGFFNFSYFVKAVAEINGDIEIRFWIENKTGYIFTSGQDTFYMEGYEEKTKTKKLFLPRDLSSGTYEFYVQVVYGNYIASAHRTIGIEVKNGTAEISFGNRYGNFPGYAISALIGIGVFIVCLIFYLERKKIKKGFIKEEKWIKKHRISILAFVLFIILGILSYYFRLDKLIVNWFRDFY